MGVPETPRTNIFFSGTVHEAIASSLQQRSPLVCFVTDNGDESKKWEDEYLVDSEVYEHLQSGVVLLRLEAGSQDATLLAEVCPVQEIPHLLVIRDGAVLTKLTSGVQKEEFTANLKNSLSRPPTSPVRVASPSAPQPYPAPTQSVASPAVSQPYSAPTQSVVPQPAPLPPRPSTSTPPPRPETDLPPSRRGSLRPSSQSYLEAQRAKKAAENAERQRILQLLESDKAERRARERERKGTISTPPPTATTRPPPVDSGEVALSFRLIDGSNIKSRFPSTALLSQEVRAWIEANRTDGDHPFNFTEIQDPSHNRSLSISDENIPLGELFRRSATLVLVPTQTFTSAAYEGAASAGTGLLSRAYGLATGVLNAVWSLGNFAPRTEEREGRTEERNSQGRDSSRVRTLRDQETKDDSKEYYNGNQLSFQPKPDEK